MAERRNLHGLRLFSRRQELFLGSANHGEIIVFGMKHGAVVDRINISGGGYRDSFLGDFLI